ISTRRRLRLFSLEYAALGAASGPTGNGRSPKFNGRRQPSIDGTSRMSREVQVRICERLGVKFPGPTRQKAKYSLRADVFRFAPDSGHVATAAPFPFRAKNRPLREWRPLAQSSHSYAN